MARAYFLKANFLTELVRLTEAHNLGASVDDDIDTFCINNYIVARIL